jgi:acylphosphatase
VNERLHLRIRGRVQGVAFRASAREEAQALGLTGWVRNEADGSVEALAEGPREALDGFHAWCRRGPPSARVTEVDTLSRGPASGEYKDFSVSFTGTRPA